MPRAAPKLPRYLPCQPPHHDPERVIWESPLQRLRLVPWRAHPDVALLIGGHRYETKASIPLDAIRRPRNTPIWKLEASLKYRSCRKGKYAPPVHMIRLTEQREVTPYVRVHSDEER